jgi:Protein of unknown function (DUF3592)
LRMVLTAVFEHTWSRGSEHQDARVFIQGSGNQPLIATKKTVKQNEEHRMYYPPLVRKSRFFGAKLIWMSMILSLLVAGGLFFGLGFSTVQVRLNGVQTTAIAHADGICASDENSSGDSYSFTYEFTGTNGQQYRIAQDSFCTNVYYDGDHVTIWYMPNDPSQVRTDLDVHMLYLFLGVGMLPIVSFWVVFVMIPLMRRKVARTNLYANYPYNQVGLR